MVLDKLYPSYSTVKILEQILTEKEKDFPPNPHLHDSHILDSINKICGRTESALMSNVFIQIAVAVHIARRSSGQFH